MILGIDTSLGTGVAVIEDDGEVRAVAASDDPRGHAEVIGRLLAEAVGDTEISHVAVGMGPGPFTGLRVGIAAARAFALGRGIPVVPVASHDAIALERLTAEAIAGDDPSRFAVVTDARRREVAYSVYEGLDDDGLPVRVAGPALAPATDDRFTAENRGRDDTPAVAGRLDADGVLRATSVPPVFVALAAARALAAGRRIATDAPIYLRAPDVTVPRGPKRVTA